MSTPITPTPRARTYADGFGNWHAVLSADTRDPERKAVALITEELRSRGELGEGYVVKVRRETGRHYTSDSLRYVEDHAITA